ncbi:octanoyltransferase [Heyndrickxia sporothermodurans]|uniref:Lipoate--protein ligase family protein n=1 Tax=Heyndrickxia sporothermodurans TaxID=46224 RepID=A0AB37HG50_9BACI|nr:lipoate--protein ligase family protein [Heyndrickxia sporothermodurans]MBL5766230.1 lipoate--protein ligase family protein [Heyndrickxia sporothermodurans]MBL5769670.1 lipoate--protein ligase family protein [Heyndrickxia sporothermodurans]MBL5773566.1 lipoate--protein ligase family protein [Heyndrickxia sporothermodurans]MBL5776827.1 lipoate--protein ligase family protein [Heyndrickxia sporothermodurans]MBL5780428.1 lipoate--protein ligase family protein [Heyndrickxia sporothermodurans]
MSETWYFIDSGVQSPVFNMAMDEVLLDWHSRDLIPPVLRFYTWDPAALSLGHFQKTTGRINTQAAKEKGIDIVRRPTGGLAVLHDQELTYSMIISEKHEKMSPSIIETYRVLSQGILEGYRKLGISAELAVPNTPIGKSGTAVCFEESSWYELEIDGKKAAGSAQTRQKGVVLQHGSIPMEIDIDTLYDLFVFPNEKVKNKAKTAFTKKAVTINQILGRKTTIDEIKNAFMEGIKKGLNIDLTTYEPNNQMLKEVEELMQSKYANEDYTFQR